MNPFDRFEFSQSSLQDYVDCCRRFQLRYLQHITWPAIPADPALENERRLQRGDRFHRLIQQFLVGVPTECLSQAAAADPDDHVLAWWEHFIQSVPALLTGDRLVEHKLSAPLNGSRLSATFDLILLDPGGRLTIYDWKTSQRRPRSTVLRARLQTRVYPYLLVRAGAAVTDGRAVYPSQVEMIYWFADPDHSPEHIQYTQEQFQADSQFISGLIADVSHCRPEDFEMTHQQERCSYCVYRSLCERGDRAGPVESDAFQFEDPDPTNIDFDLEQIAEVRF